MNGYEPVIGDGIESDAHPPPDRARLLPHPRISYVIITRNRCAVLLETLRRLLKVTSAELSPDDWEVIVVDNDSSDDTARVVSREYPWVTVIGLNENRGCAGRNVGVGVARGRWVVFLDDDSSPRPGGITTALDFLDRHPGIGVLGGRVYLPDGSRDGSAIPLVPPGCGMIVSRSVFLEVGGFCPVLLRQAEEYDLVFRVMRAGYTVHRLPGVGFDHEKTSTGRDRESILRLDLRNNLLLTWRYFPRPLRRVFHRHWLRRYATLLRGNGHDNAVWNAIADARGIIHQERAHQSINPRRLLSEQTLETLLGFDRQKRLIREWSRRYGVRRVVIADYTKTLPVTIQACRDVGIEVVAVTDNHPGYRGTGQNIVTDRQAAKLDIDGVILSNVNPAQVSVRDEQLRRVFDIPVLSFETSEGNTEGGMGLENQLAAISEAETSNPNPMNTGMKMTTPRTDFAGTTS